MEALCNRRTASREPGWKLYFSPDDHQKLLCSSVAYGSKITLAKMFCWTNDDYKITEHASSWGWGNQSGIRAEACPELSQNNGRLHQLCCSQEVQPSYRACRRYWGRCWHGEDHSYYCGYSGEEGGATGRVSFLQNITYSGSLAH